MEFKGFRTCDSGAAWVAGFALVPEEREGTCAARPYGPRSAGAAGAEASATVARRGRDTARPGLDAKHDKAARAAGDAQALQLLQLQTLQPSGNLIAQIPHLVAPQTVATDEHLQLQLDGNTHQIHEALRQVLLDVQLNTQHTQQHAKHIRTMLICASLGTMHLP